MSEEKIRLQKYVAGQGICSRRKAEDLIKQGLILVNDKKVELGTKIDPNTDRIKVLGDFANEKIDNKYNQEKVLIALNKPIDYICSTTSSQGISIMELLSPENFWKKAKPIIKGRVYPVGRLDKDSEGLVLLTNDGELANKLMHPKFSHEKEYELTIDKMLTRDAKKILTNGMNIGDGEYVAGIRIIKVQKIGRKVLLHVILQEGKNRQIRKMFGRLGYDLYSLRRIRIANIKLGTLPIGKWRFINMDKVSI